MKALLVQCTASSVNEARAIARALLEARLAACVSLAGHVESHYRWRGKIEQTNEVLLLIKTTRTRFEAVRRTILEHHGYEVPEIIAVDVVAGHGPYLKWLAESVRGKAARA